MNLNELLKKIDDKHIEYDKHSIFISSLEDQFKDQDIVIHTNEIRLKNEHGNIFTINIQHIRFINCNFKSINMHNKINIKYFELNNVNIDKLIFENQNLTLISIAGIFDSFKLTKSKVEQVRIISETKISSISFEHSEVKDIDMQIRDIKYINFTRLNNCNKLTINTGGKLFSQYKNANIERILISYCENINHISISSLLFPLHIKTLYLDKFFNVKEFELKNVSLDYVNLHSRKVYDKLNVSFSDVKIFNQLKIKDIDLGQSVFKKLNLSKCEFHNSLVSKSLFHECKIDKIPDIPLVKFKKLSFALIFSIPIAIAVISQDYTGLGKEELIYVLTSMMPYVFTFLVITLLLFFYKHVATLDEEREKHKDFSKNVLKATKEFIKSTIKSFKNFIWKMDEKELLKLKEIESLNRQLKVAFEASKDTQNANEFVYSEMLMKIRQKNIWMNLVSVDFWNYLINGFGRRWRRALMNFFIVFFLAVLVFLNSTPFQFEVKENAPQFIQESNKILLRAIPQEALDKGFFTLINVDDNTTQKPKKELKDGTFILTNLLKLSSVYTLSKIDIFKVKTNRWFEETSFENFFKANAIGIILLFLFGSFVLAFKRRLDK